MFDPSAARARLERLWKLTAQFGVERNPVRVFLDEIVSDRLQLLAGLQVLRDELHFAKPPPHASDREACGADFSLPSVVPTLAFTNCGDRIHQGEIERYQQMVGTRFATISEVGALKPEAFRPTGGGTDDGATLALVTWAHALDDPLRKRIYEGNAQSFVLCAFDLTTHVGRLDRPTGTSYGTTEESSFREPRTACGAIVGALKGFDEKNAVHRRIRANLGEASFEHLAKQGVHTATGKDVTAAVAAAIVAVQGMLDTAHALRHEMDERGVAHLTASITVNRASTTDTIIYLARATVFGGELRVQGLGTDARKYGAEMIEEEGGRVLRLTYDGHKEDGHAAATSTYEVRKTELPKDPFV